VEHGSVSALPDLRSYAHGCECENAEDEAAHDPADAETKVRAARQMLHTVDAPSGGADLDRDDRQKGDQPGEEQQQERRRLGGLLVAPDREQAERRVEPREHDQYRH